MSNIPIFNDGDLLGTIRTQSLNPLINSVNKLVPKVDDAITDIAISGQTLTVTHSDTSKHSVLIPTIKGDKGDPGPKGDPLTPQDIYNAENRGTAPNSGSIKALDNGWWYVPSSNTQITGKPKGSTGDLLVYKRTIDPSGTAMLAYGMDKDGAQVWAEFKTATSGGYVPWVKLSVTDILTIDSVEQQLKAKGWGPVSGNVPQPSSHMKYYAGYDTSFPTSLADLTGSDTNTISISRTGSTAERIFVAVTSSVAKRVTGIKVDTGLAAVWQYRDQNIDGQEYRVFYSPGAFYDTSETIVIEGVS